jgi:hypothetical protein
MPRFVGFSLLVLLFSALGVYTGRLTAQNCQQNCSPPPCSNQVDGNILGKYSSHQCYSLHCTTCQDAVSQCLIETCNSCQWNPNTKTGCQGGTGEQCPSSACDLNVGAICMNQCGCN